MSAIPLDESPLPRLPQRAAEGHKGDYGRVVVIGGSTGMAGAAALAGKAALRSGAGLVRVAVPADCAATVAVFEPALMTVPLACDDQGRIAAAARDEIARQVDWASVVALGPGLGSSDELSGLVGWLYAECDRPLVVDADGLNALARERDLLARHAAPRIMTPHPGEFARLSGLDMDDLQSRRAEACRELARRATAVVVLKGHGTCTSDGARLAVNATGNPGMATGGTGDVLTGVTAALVGQQLPPYDAARLAVHLHGLAGDLAAAQLGPWSLISSDLLAFLPAAFVAHARSATSG